MPIESEVNIALQCEPVAPEHLVPMRWVEDFVFGKVKAPVRLVATVNQAGTYSPAAKTFTYSATGQVASFIDDRGYVVGDRVLFVGQTDATQNGIYVVTSVGTDTPPTSTVLTRARDWNESSLIYQGATIGVNEGAANANTHWKLITGGTIVLDTTALEFLKITPPTAVRRFQAPIGLGTAPAPNAWDGTTREFELVHNLGTAIPVVQVYNGATWALVLVDVTVTGSNTVTIGFANPPQPGDPHYNVAVLG